MVRLALIHKFDKSRVEAVESIANAFIHGCTTDDDGFEAGGVASAVSLDCP